MAKGNSQKPANGSALDFEAQLWAAADKMRGHMDASEYKHVCLGLIFLKYISDTFEDKREQLLFGYADPKSEWFIKDEPQRAEAAENRDEYLAANVFWLPPEARWHKIKARAKSPEIGKLIDDAMGAIERENPTLKGVLPRDYARPSLDTATRDSANPICAAHWRDFRGTKDHVRLGGLVDIISNIGFNESAVKAKDVLGRELSGSASRTKQSRVHRQVRRLPAGVGGVSLQAGTTGRSRNRSADSPVSDWGGENLWPDVRCFSLSASNGERAGVRCRIQSSPVNNANYAWIQHFIHRPSPVGVAGFDMAKTTRSAHSWSKKITEDALKYAAEQGIAEEEAPKRGMEAKSKEFVGKGAEVYAKA
jgi:hypothetical protein